MAATEHLKSIKANVMLNNGTSATGAVKTKAMSIGLVNASAWDADKFLAISNALAPILGKSVFETDAVKTYQVYE